MRIAFVTHQFPRLPNTFILNEITEILRMGHEVTIYSLNRSQETVVHTDVFEYGLMDRTRYVLDFVREDPANSRRFQTHAKDRLQRHIHAFPEVGEQLLGDGTQVIHAAFGNQPCTAALALAEVTGLPLTFETHARDLFVDFMLSQEKIAAAERIFTISDYNRRYLMEQHGCPAQKVVLKRVSIQERLCDQLEGASREEGLLVFVGRLHPIKGIEYALRAMALVLETHEDARFCVVGDGDLKGILGELARELGIQNRVQFTGPLTNREALEHVSRATGFLLPSVIADDGDRDGIPTAIIEAMYLRTPAISTTVSGIPELIEDGVNGWLVPPGDVSVLAERVRHLLDHPAQRAEMGKRAREKVISQFNSASNTKLILDAWREIVGHA